VCIGLLLDTLIVRSFVVPCILRILRPWFCGRHWCVPVRYGRDRACQIKRIAAVRSPVLSNGKPATAWPASTGWPRGCMSGGNAPEVLVRAQRSSTPAAGEKLT
jgi:hypothetical protein